MGRREFRGELVNMVDQEWDEGVRTLAPRILRYRSLSLFLVYFVVVSRRFCCQFKHEGEPR